jgi:TonB family protein
MLRSFLLRALPSLAFMSALAAFTADATAASEIDQHLRDAYQNKTFVLRGFYPGTSLRFDSAGSPPAGTPPGDWAVNGFVQVEDIRLAGGRLKIRASRLHLGWTHDGLKPLHDFIGKDKPDKDEGKTRSLQIEADLGPETVTTEIADAALSRIFLTPQDRLADLVPDYWKPCISDGLVGKGNSCHFPPEFASIPGVALPANADAEPSTTSTGTAASSGPIFRMPKGVSPPKVTSQHEPEFSDPARLAKFQGTMTLGLLVDTSGVPTNIHILSPLGCGLDEKAVRAVQGWRFRPAEKDGRPVAVEIAVEVDFHLY